MAIAKPGGFSSVAGFHRGLHFRKVPAVIPQSRPLGPKKYAPSGAHFLAAAAAAVVGIGQTVVAAAAAQQKQKDDPAEVVAAHIVVTHRK